MVKYILHGGAKSALDAENKLFFSEITKNLENNSTILLVCFSRKKEDYNRCFAKDSKMFLDNSNNKKLNFLVPNEENFIEALKMTDAVYLRGVDQFQLLNTLKKYTEFIDLLKTKKIVAGSSAGAYVLSKYFFSNSKNDIFEGLGVLPIKLICHYEEEKHKRVIKEFENIGEKLEVVKLREFEFKIF